MPATKSGMKVGENEKPMVKGRRITGNERSSLAQDLNQRYAEGASIRSLAQETGRSYGFVHRILCESGVSMRGRGGATRGKKN